MRCAEWVKGGTSVLSDVELRPLTEENGEVIMPMPETICDFLLQVSTPGVWMTDETKMAYGWGAYANVPYSYASVEMYVCLAGALRRRRGGH